MRKHFAQFDKERKTFQERNRRSTQPIAMPTESDVTPSLLGVVAPPTNTSTNDTAQDNSAPDEVVDIIEGDGGDQNIQNMLSSIVYSLGLDESETLVAISNWHKRHILPTIDSATISSEQARLYELRSLENEWIETESNKIIQLPTPVPSPPTPEGRSLRSGRTIDTREFSGYYEYEEGERGGASPPVHEGDSDSDALIDEGWDTGR
ncbi:PREDICTED: uncharacterized protein LOC109592224 [Amphimedon queenslandica]|uniref:Uncharacterized protein n=1 Tax=Amphimedon queenslandica TaxID=400682 RepID=A0A1X7SNF4_AMPQE|nr:PREDICTED: uncharacterized protein LOC109592224 [Amphimedon queenslandica]|eukprot:XP_019863293.1 PREDICTED: uncharacterized protein LOC109592224 [Amphimedon queenslandica]